MWMELILTKDMHRHLVMDEENPEEIFNRKKVYGKIEFISSWAQFNEAPLAFHAPNIIAIDFVNFIYLQNHDTTHSHYDVNNWRRRFDSIRIRMENCYRAPTNLWWLNESIWFLFNGFGNYESLKMKVRACDACMEKKNLSYTLKRYWNNWKFTFHRSNFLISPWITKSSKWRHFGAVVIAK